MSSRSFRRRNNRRKHKDGSAQEGQAQKPDSPQGEQSSGPRRQRDQVGARKGGGQRREGRGPGRGGSGRADEPPRPALQEAVVVYPDCPICGKTVRDLASALTHRISRQPAHFDCIMQELRDTNEISPQEKICYLGGGCFGILEFRPSGGPGHFVIKKRIQYEEKEYQQDWKKPLQISW
jgi:hypothetical protein